MNQPAYDAIEEAWQLTIKVRAVTPYPGETTIQTRVIVSPGWYQARGASYVVGLPARLSKQNLEELKKVGGFINRSFVISMVAILEEHGVVPYKTNPNRSLDGGDHVQLAKWMRNRFAHGDWTFDSRDSNHVETRALLEKLFPAMANFEPGFPTPIDRVLEPLKDGVLRYIEAAT